MAQFAAWQGERGHLTARSLTDGSLEFLFVPTEPPRAGSKAAQRLAAGVKLLSISPMGDEIRIFPTDTRRWVDEFLGPKYAQIKTIILHNILESDLSLLDGVRAVLEPDPVFGVDELGAYDPDPDVVTKELGDLLGAVLPSGFTKGHQYGFGFTQECAPIIQLIEEHTDCDTLEFVQIGESGINGPVLRLSFAQFGEMRTELARIKDRGNGAILRVKRAFAHNALAEVLGLEPTKYSSGRNPASRLVAHAAAGDEPLSDREWEALLSAATSQASKSPQHLARLRRDVELVNLDQLIDAYGSALGDRHTENWWQRFFDQNIFALQLLFGGPTVFVDSQLPIGEDAGSNKGKKIADYLFENPMTNNAALVEIKRPSTQLLSRRPYRAGVYGIHSEISKSVTQVLDQAQRLTRHEEPTRSRALDGSWRSTAPRCFVVAGLGTELDTVDKKRSFELFREHLSGVRLATYDEVLEQLKSLREFFAHEATET